jgi:precorrin-6B methylase 1
MAGARLVVVGTGIQLGRHLTGRALSEIRAAERVFALVDAPMMAWLLELRPDLQDLATCYAADRDRRDSYADMEARIHAALLEGRHVCAVFYGHPGVYAQVPHAAVARARAAGIAARMEPGISAEACLYADLGLDPGRHGMQSWEATQFMIRDRAPDPSSLLILWQIAVAGRLDCVGFDPCPRRLALLVDKLGRWYPAETPAILYEAARLPIEDFRAERIVLAELPRSTIREHTTLVIPPVRSAAVDATMRQRLEALGPSPIAR